MNLNKIRIGHSPLTDKIFLFRCGKKDGVVLDKREAEADVMTALIAHMMHNAPGGSEKVVQLEYRKYTVRVTPFNQPGNEVSIVNACDGCKHNESSDCKSCIRGSNWEADT